MSTTTISPARIGCPSLSGTMKGIVMGMRGVEAVKVNYEERSFVVTYDEAVTSPEAIVKAIGAELGLAMEVGESDGKKGGNVADTFPM